jgi:hypothetical protein
MPLSFGEVVRKFIYDLALASNPRTLFNFLVKKIIFFLTRHASVYPTPDLIFGGISDGLERYRGNYLIAAEKIVPIHSLDHDVYLCFLARTGEVVQNKTCVFLDEAATHHSDFALLNISPIEEKSYFASMNTLFDRIEQETGLTVIVAAHPRSDYDKLPGAFGGRAIVKGKSVDLVASSSLVVTHASTAISFAVLFEKPLLLVKTMGIADNSHYSLLVDTIARSLGIQAQLIDGDEFAHHPINYCDMSPDGYRDYLYKYVKSPFVEGLTVWEVVARELCRYNTASNRTLSDD